MKYEPLVSFVGDIQEQIKQNIQQKQLNQIQEIKLRNEVKQIVSDMIGQIELNNSNRTVCNIKGSTRKSHRKGKARIIS